MSLAIDASTPAAFTSSSGTATSASFTPPAASYLIVAFAGNSTGGANPSAPTITDNLGAHLTYTRWVWRSRADGSPTVDGHVAIWTAPISTSAAMTVSVTQSVAELACKVWVVTGAYPADPVGAVGGAGSASASSVSQQYTAEGTSGQGFLAVCDWAAIGVETAGTGCTMDATGNVGAGQISYGFARRTNADDSNGAPNTLNANLLLTSTSLQWAWIEMLETPPDPDLLDPPVQQIPPWLLYALVQRARNERVDLASQEISVTATQGGVTANGIAMTVKVLTGAAATQNGATNTSTSITTPELAITPNANGSRIYGSLVNANGTTSWTADAASTFFQNIPDATNSCCYCTYKSTNTTTAATPVTCGASSPTGQGTGGICEAEILASGTLTEDASAPAAVSKTTGISVSTLLFTPPPGSLLVAMVSSDGGAGVCTMTVAGGSLTWTELVKANGSAKGYTGVWIAQVPAGTNTDWTQDATDSAGLTDSLVLEQDKVVTDSVGLTDTTAFEQDKAVTDSAGLTDTTLVEPLKVVSATDSAGLTDTFAVEQDKAATDSVGLTDSAAAEQGRIVTDSAGLTDTSLIEPVKLVAVTDDAGLSDTAILDRSDVFTDGAGLTDTTALTQQKVITDSSGLTDTATTVAGKTLDVTDSTGLTDTTAVSLTAAFTDSAGVTDAAEFARSTVFTDSAGMTDSVSMLNTKPLSATDSAGLSDTTALEIFRSLDVTDSTGLSDAVVIQGTFEPVVGAGLPITTASFVSTSTSSTNQGRIESQTVGGRS